MKNVIKSVKEVVWSLEELEDRVCLIVNNRACVVSIHNSGVLIVNDPQCEKLGLEVKRLGGRHHG